MNTPELEALRAFRQQVYPLFGCRRAALFEALDAVLTVPTLETPAHLSLAPHCQRRWGSPDDALNPGPMHLARLEELAAAYPLTPTTTWYAVEARVWPRCDAETSPERGYSHHPSVPPVPWPPPRRRLELFVVGAGTRARFEVDRSAARSPYPAWGKRESGRGRADPLLAGAGTVHRHASHLHL